MRGWAAGAGVVVVGFGLACGLRPPPDVQLLDVTVDGCGHWTATIEAQARGDTLTLTRDGTPAGSWPVSGTQTLVAQGDLPPSRAVVFQARMGSDTETQKVQVPPLAATLTITPDDATFAVGASPEFDLYLATACRVSGARLSARTGTWSSGDRPIAANSAVHLALPPAEEGSHELRVDVVSGSQPVAGASTRFFVGDASHDLDHDGYAGGPDGNDCNDHDPAVHPGQAEAPTPNGKDDNCDGRVDEGTTAYDDDRDGTSEDQGDCDDADPGVHPGAAELPDCRDQDCDGEVDEGVTLPAVDDSYEPDDSKEHAFDLGTSRMHRFDKDLVVVTRDASDDEWFRFFSQDGDFDDWGIDAEVRGLPVGAVYDVEIDDADGSMRARERVTAEHQVVHVRGSILKDDSGDYLLHVHPVQIARPWCPVTIALESR